MDNIRRVRKLTTLIHDLAIKNAFPKDAVQVFRDNHESISIDINGIDWANELTYAEAEDMIYCLFKGIELGNQNTRSHYVFR